MTDARQRDAEADHQELLALNRKLRVATEALRPFADYDEARETYVLRGVSPLLVARGRAGRVVCIGDAEFRAAAAALSEIEKEDG